jgi:hypothetical protein
MSSTVTIEFDSRFEQGVRRALALFEEMEQLALTAPDGEVLDQCEQAVIEKGRQLQAATLAEAVGRRVEAAEKKGRRSACAAVAARRKTVAPKLGR